MNMNHGRMGVSRMAAATILIAGTTCAAVAADWNNAGGNSSRNGLTSEIGPEAAADVAWTYTERTSTISYQPVTEGSRMFVVRQANRVFEPITETNSPVVAIDLETGVELWHTDILYTNGDDTTWVGGVKDGLVFACRGGDGWQEMARVYALRTDDGSVVWASEDEVNAGPYQGVVFADNGDLIIGSFKKLQRIRWTDGATVWSVDRVGSVAANCGAAIFGDGVYIVDYDIEHGGDGTMIVKHNLATGAKMYEGQVMRGGTVQNTPFCGPDGTVYLSRTRPNGPDVNNFYSFRDTGTALIENWHVPAGYSSSSEFGMGPDGSVYMIAPGNIIQRLDPQDGSVISSSAAIPTDTTPFPTPRFVVDGDGKVFFSNGAFYTGRLYSFNADLTERWSVEVTKPTTGGPALGQNGTLVQVGTTGIQAWRTERVVCAVDLNGDGLVDFGDYLEFLSLFDAGDLRVDFSRDGVIDFGDYLEFLNLFEAGC